MADALTYHHADGAHGDDMVLWPDEQELQPLPANVSPLMETTAWFVRLSSLYYRILSRHQMGFFYTSLVFLHQSPLHTVFIDVPAHPRLL